MAPAVLTRLETYKFLQDRHTASITASLLHEMARIAATRGIDFEDTAFFPTQTLSQLSLDGAVARLCDLGDQFASRAPAHKVSTLQDMEQGKTRLEVEETLGYAVQQGVALGVPTPTLETCYNLIAAINRYLA
jgi:ketopantoate reductase